MFKVKIDEDEYEVTFKHFIPDEKDRETYTKEAFMETFGTSCEIASTGSGLYLYGYGSSDLHPNDNFDRKIGRKIALTRALKDFPAGVRVKFWEAYKQMQGGKW